MPDVRPPDLKNGEQALRRMHIAAGKCEPNSIKVLTPQVSLHGESGQDEQGSIYIYQKE